MITSTANTIVSRRQFRRLLVLFVVVVLSSGCVRRRLTVRTNPPGAIVYIDKQKIGKTPISTPFTYYGTREIEVVRDGYRTERVTRNLTPPWYQIPPLDFVTESLWPQEIADERTIDITMVPIQAQSPEVVMSRANDLRMQASQAIATAPIVPVNSLPPAGSGDLTVPSYLPLPPSAAPAQPNYGLQSNAPLQNLFQPNGIPPTRLPEVGILPGGGYRPPIAEPTNP